jgi:DNA ligase (NAD+)
MLTREQIRSLPGFAEISTENLYSALQKAKAVPLNRFLYAAGVPEVGRALCRDLARLHGTYEEFMADAKNDFTKSATLAGVGHVILEIMKNYADVWEELAVFVKPLPYFRESIPVPKHKHSFVITGSFNVPRQEIEDDIRSAGHAVSGSVSKKTSYVVCGADPGSKLEKAQSLGIRVIGLERLYEIIREETADANAE